MRPRVVPKAKKSEDIYFLPLCLLGKGKGKANPLQIWTGAKGSKRLRFPDFMTTAQDGGRMPALRTGRLYSQDKSTDTSWDRTSDLPICSTAH